MDEDMTQPPKKEPGMAARFVAGFLLVLAVGVVLAVLAIGWVFYDLRNGIFGGTH